MGHFVSPILILLHFLFFVSHIGDVQFIDYEYSGYNYLAYDIGNHFNEFAGGVLKHGFPIEVPSKVLG